MVVVEVATNWVVVKVNSLSYLEEAEVVEALIFHLEVLESYLGEVVVEEEAFHS